MPLEVKYRSNTKHTWYHLFQFRFSNLEAINWKLNKMRGLIMFLMFSISLSIYNKANASSIEMRSFDAFENHVGKQEFSFKHEILKDFLLVKRIIMIRRLRRQCQRTKYENLCNSLHLILLHGSFEDKQHAKGILVNLLQVAKQNWTNPRCQFDSLRILIKK